jgi:F0F1-type ATP synthase alpha subunit
MIMPILRYFATKCKVLSRRGALLTLSDPASIKIHEAIKYTSVKKGIEGKAMCTSIHTNFNKYIDLSEQTNLLEAGEEILIDKTNIYAPRTTGEIVGPCTSSSNGVSLAYTVKQRLREKSKQLPKQLFTKYIAIDLNQPIIEGEFAVMLGPSNRGKSKISQSSILSHIQKQNHYSIYCSASLENCKFLQVQPAFVKEKCTIIYSDLKKLESIASFFSSLKIAEAMSTEKKNTLLVLDDVVQQLVHERSHQVPSDMLVILLYSQYQMWCSRPCR